MYGIFTHIYHTFRPNAGKYIHGWYGIINNPDYSVPAVYFPRCISGPEELKPQKSLS